MNALQIRTITPSDREWVRSTLIAHWSSVHIASRGHLIDASDLPGFIADFNQDAAGLITYQVAGEECEVVTLNSLRAGEGIGTALLDATRKAAVAAGCRRLWLITTNDNVAAVHFYLMRGMRLVRIHPDAITESRRLKPTIPLLGDHGLPLRDELEFEILFGELP